MTSPYSLIMTFIEPKENRRAMQALHESNAGGATILYGRGTCDNALLCLMGIDNPRKEILLTVAKNERCENILGSLYKALQLRKKAHGIIVTLPLSRVYGLHSQDHSAEGYNDQQGVNQVDYEMIVVIVDNGRGEDVVEVAQKSGATGATLLHGRGSGAHTVEHFFNLEIEPEKEVVLIVSGSKDIDAIIAGIRGAIDFDKPNSGILFTLDINKAIGLYNREQN